MQRIDKVYIGGRFVSPHGTEQFELIDPSNNETIGVVTLGDVEDARAAVAAARKAFETFAFSTIEERLDILERLYQAARERADDLTAAQTQEFGAPVKRSRFATGLAVESFRNAQVFLKEFDFTRKVGHSTVEMVPLGVAALITPWNANAGFICNKVSTAIAAGCATVIKPSEMSAIQTQIVTEFIHAAGLPAGLVNIVNGRGDTVGAEFTSNPHVAKISFTGSTAVGKAIARGAADTLKRVTLELGGKSPNILLDDADFEKAVPQALGACFYNGGQACIAGTRLLVPEARLEEVVAIAERAVKDFPVGDPKDDRTLIGPMVSTRQYERVQSLIETGIKEGARLVTGGLGQPEGLEKGNFVKATVFADVTNDMTIARQEIFGPVLSILTYRDEEDAIRIANDTDYGLHAYVSSSNPERARKVASRLYAGRVAINSPAPNPFAPFGGFKQSGIGREYGTYGLEEYLEPRAVMIDEPQAMLETAS
ncbi:aldehyde dehydrogenase (NAD+) [Faunimonas pinastri]|uniref:aldehyde dehydrogenase (NAD(+)) n=1 Tax=Faunimonas pinastri TaxID=1855383 RepID=A0A1H9K8T1_9HYPH|nr:aldehyde dehydrogenase family protein [Faunimonas pinastri]SEQ95541.1 aldehyde dehydrogenase (NAD+) [Faunimonas pinastri]